MSVINETIPVEYEDVQEQPMPEAQLLERSFEALNGIHQAAETGFIPPMSDAIGIAHRSDPSFKIEVNAIDPPKEKDHSNPLAAIIAGICGVDRTCADECCDLGKIEQVKVRVNLINELKVTEPGFFDQPNADQLLKELVASRLAETETERTQNDIVPDSTKKQSDAKKKTSPEQAKPKPSIPEAWTRSYTQEELDQRKKELEGTYVKGEKKSSNTLNAAPSEDTVENNSSTATSQTDTQKRSTRSSSSPQQTTSIHISSLEQTVKPIPSPAPEPPTDAKINPPAKTHISVNEPDSAVPNTPSLFDEPIPEDSAPPLPGNERQTREKSPDEELLYAKPDHDVPVHLRTSKVAESIKRQSVQRTETPSEPSTHHEPVEVAEETTVPETRLQQQVEATAPVVPAMSAITEMPEQDSVRVPELENKRKSNTPHPSIAQHETVFPIPVVNHSEAIEKETKNNNTTTAIDRKDIATPPSRINTFSQEIIPSETTHGILDDERRDFQTNIHNLEQPIHIPEEVNDRSVRQPEILLEKAENPANVVDKFTSHRQGTEKAATEIIDQESASQMQVAPHIINISFEENEKVMLPEKRTSQETRELETVLIDIAEQVIDSSVHLEEDITETIFSNTDPVIEEPHFQEAFRTDSSTEEVHEDIDHSEPVVTLEDYRVNNLMPSELDEVGNDITGNETLQMLSTDELQHTSELLKGDPLPPLYADAETDINIVNIPQTEIPMPNYSKETSEQSLPLEFVPSLDNTPVIEEGLDLATAPDLNYDNIVSDISIPQPEETFDDSNESTSPTPTQGEVNINEGQQDNLFIEIEEDTFTQFLKELVTQQPSADETTPVIEDEDTLLDEDPEQEVMNITETGSERKIWDSTIELKEPDHKVSDVEDLDTPLFKPAVETVFATVEELPQIIEEIVQIEESQPVMIIAIPEIQVNDTAWIDALTDRDLHTDKEKIHYSIHLPDQQELFGFLDLIAQISELLTFLHQHNASNTLPTNSETASEFPVAPEELKNNTFWQYDDSVIMAIWPIIQFMSYIQHMQIFIPQQKYGSSQLTTVL